MHDERTDLNGVAVSLKEFFDYLAAREETKELADSLEMLTAARFGAGRRSANAPSAAN